MSTTTPETPAAVFRLIYRSRARIPDDRRRVALGELFSQARSNNKDREITGALLVSGDCFVQTLEGEEAVVRRLFARIEADPRHEAVAVLAATTVADRVFSRWAMAKVAEDGEPDIPLIKNKKGITAAASRPLTPAQEQLLQVMREAATALVDLTAQEPVAAEGSR